MMPEWVVDLLNSPLAGGVASGLIFLGGIKVEIRAIHEKLSAVASSAQRAHVRLDDHVDKHHVGVKRA